MTSCTKDDANFDGFSSDDQQMEQEQIKVVETQIQISSRHKQEVRFVISPPTQIRSRSYSLAPDIITGWSSKNQLPTPVPLTFENKRIDPVAKKLLQKKQQKALIVYFGPRYLNTFQAWYKKSFDNPYSHMQTPHNMKFTDRMFFGQHWDAEDSLQFDSAFESANLDIAIQVGENQYDLYLRVDSNTRGHLQWFNFKIKNLIKQQKYRLNICNISKQKTLYSRGQKPYIFSNKKYEKLRQGWQQCGQFVTFQQKCSKSVKITKTQLLFQFQLSFEYCTEFDNDQIQIAYCIPYTYSQMMEDIQNLANSEETKYFMKNGTLCKSLGGLAVPLITIHEGIPKQADIGFSYGLKAIQATKKCVIISGRVHPGQSNSSYIMKGFIQFLCGKSKEAKTLRTNFIFKIVPMLNPDGVILGNYRTGVSGKDFNREYKNPDKSVFPEIFNFKKLVMENKQLYGEELLMFLDFHGHSTKKNVFVYGPQFPIIDKYYYQCRIFPKLLGDATKMFRYHSCNFKVASGKQTTARAVFLRKILIPLSYTIQASNGSYFDKDELKDINFTQQSWQKMGSKIGVALVEYFNIVLISQAKKRRNQHQKPLPVKKSTTLAKQTMVFNHKLETQSSNTATENPHLLKIINDIKREEQQKQKQIKNDNEKNQNKDEKEIERQENEEDLISQGCSDDEGQGDDLPNNKLAFLFDVIRKKKIPSKEQMQRLHDHRQSISAQSDQITKQIRLCQSIDRPILKKLQLVVKDHGQEYQSIPVGQISSKSIYFRSRQTCSLWEKDKKQKQSARVINFSFIDYNRPYLLANQVKFNSQKIEQKIKMLDPRVLDFSNQFGRQNFIGYGMSNTVYKKELLPSNPVKIQNNKIKEYISKNNISSKSKSKTRN